MAIQEATEQQEKTAKTNLSICGKSLIQDAEQKTIEKLIEAKKTLDNVNQQLAQFPEKAIGQLNTAIYKLLKIINGHVSNLSKEFDPKKIIDELEKLIKPIIKALSSLPVPEIPGLKQIIKLLALLKSLLESTSNADGQPITVDISVDIPPALIDALTDLLSALQSLCATLPLVFINLVFKMFQCVINVLKRLASAIGISLTLPYPLNIVPQCSDLLPDIMDFMLQVPSKLNNVIQGILKKIFGKISSLQFPSMPDTVNMPSFLPSCPQRDIKKQAEITAEQKNQISENAEQAATSSKTDISKWNAALEEAGIDPNAIVSEVSSEPDIDYSFGNTL